MTLRAVIAFAILAVALTTPGWARPWKDKSGRSINAQFIRIHNGNVILKQGKRIRQVPFATLSEEDQTYVEAQLAKSGDSHLLPPKPAAINRAAQAASGNSAKASAGLSETGGATWPSTSGSSPSPAAGSSWPSTSSAVAASGSGSGGASWPSTTTATTPQTSWPSTSSTSAASGGVAGGSSWPSTTSTSAAPSSWPSTPPSSVSATPASPNPSSLASSSTASNPFPQVPPPFDAGQNATPRNNFPARDPRIGVPVEVLSCSNCLKEVPSTSKAGSRCPHCGIRWDYSENEKSSYNAGRKFGYRAAVVIVLAAVGALFKWLTGGTS